MSMTLCIMICMVVCVENMAASGEVTILVVSSCLATKVFIGNLLTMGRG